MQGELIQTPTGEKRFRLSDIIGQENGIGVENLQVGCAEPLGWQEGMANGCIYLMVWCASVSSV